MYKNSSSFKLPICVFFNTQDCKSFVLFIYYDGISLNYPVSPQLAIPHLIHTIGLVVLKVKLDFLFVCWVCMSHFVAPAGLKLLICSSSWALNSQQASCFTLPSARVIGISQDAGFSEFWGALIEPG